MSSHHSNAAPVDDEESVSAAPTPRILVDTLDDWARVRASYTAAARAALTARLEGFTPSDATRSKGKGVSKEDRERLERAVDEVRTFILCTSREAHCPGRP